MWRGAGADEIREFERRAGDEVEFFARGLLTAATAKISLPVQNFSLHLPIPPHPPQICCFYFEPPVQPSRFSTPCLVSLEFISRPRPSAPLAISNGPVEPLIVRQLEDLEDASFDNRKLERRRSLRGQERSERKRRSKKNLQRGSKSLRVKKETIKKTGLSKKRGQKGWVENRFSVGGRAAVAPSAPFAPEMRCCFASDVFPVSAATMSSCMKRHGTEDNDWGTHAKIKTPGVRTACTQVRCFSQGTSANASPSGTIHGSAMGIDLVRPAPPHCTEQGHLSDEKKLWDFYRYDLRQCKICRAKTNSGASHILTHLHLQTGAGTEVLMQARAALARKILNLVTKDSPLPGVDFYAAAEGRKINLKELSGRELGDLQKPAFAERADPFPVFKEQMQSVRKKYYGEEWVPFYIRWIAAMFKNTHGSLSKIRNMIWSEKKNDPALAAYYLEFLASCYPRHFGDLMTQLPENDDVRREWVKLLRNPNAITAAVVSSPKQTFEMESPLFVSDQQGAITAAVVSSPKQTFEMESPLFVSDQQGKSLCKLCGLEFSSGSLRLAHLLNHMPGVVWNNEVLRLGTCFRGKPLDGKGTCFICKQSEITFCDWAPHAIHHVKGLVEVLGKETKLDVSETDRAYGAIALHAVGWMGPNATLDCVPPRDDVELLEALYGHRNNMFQAVMYIHNHHSDARWAPFYLKWVGDCKLRQLGRNRDDEKTGTLAEFVNEAHRQKEERSMDYLADLLECYCSSAVLARLGEVTAASSTTTTTPSPNGPTLSVPPSAAQHSQRGRRTTPPSRLQSERRDINRPCLGEVTAASSTTTRRHTTTPSPIGPTSVPPPVAQHSTANTAPAHPDCSLNGECTRPETGAELLRMLRWNLGKSLVIEEAIEALKQAVQDGTFVDKVLGHWDARSTGYKTKTSVDSSAALVTEIFPTTTTPSFSTQEETEKYFDPGEF